MRLLDKFIKPRGSSRAEDAEDARGPLPLRLDRVRSVQDCLDVFEAESMCEDGSLSENIISALYSRCASMRQQGMTMEPNLIGRAVQLAIAEPARAGNSALRFANHDTDFNEIVADADKVRDRREFSQAEYLYWRALLLNPRHPLILVQYAHTLKEQGKLPDALVYYLDAAVFGAPMSDVEEHALFVAGRLGLKERVRLSAAMSMPCSNDVRALYELLIGQGPSLSDIVQLMLEHESISSIVSTLIRRKEFSQANRDLLRLIAETRWSPANA